MKLFKDTNGKEWSVAINVATIKRVRDLLKVDLLQVVGGDLLPEILEDVVLFVDILFAVLKPQADAAKISDEQFAAALGDAGVLEAAQTCLLEELADFFPDARRRAAMHKAIEMHRAATRRSVKEIEEIDTEAILDQAIATAKRKASKVWSAPKKSSTSATSSVESSASTPVLSLCAN